MTLQTAIGLMSGTSGDGIDIAILRTDGLDVLEYGPTQTYSYDAPFHQKLKQLLQSSSILESYITGELHAFEQELTHYHATAIHDFCKTLPSSWQDVDLVGFHGQTIYHNPAHADTRWRSVQLGDGPLLAHLTNSPVIFDFRRADIEAGGQGAPLAPIYHRALLVSLPKPLAIINIGGIANITWVGSNCEEDLWAFDTGPGNALLDDWVYHHNGAFCDYDGQLAQAGQCQTDILNQLLTHPYFHKPPPKSLDRNDFSWAPLCHLSLEDGAATLVGLTVASIIKGLTRIPEVPHTLYISGGGRCNQAIIRDLQQQFSSKIAMIEDLGIDGDGLEAQLFAYLAIRSLYNLPLSFPNTTGVAIPTSGGRIAIPHQAPARRELIET